MIQSLKRRGGISDSEPSFKQKRFFDAEPLSYSTSRFMFCTDKPQSSLMIPSSESYSLDIELDDTFRFFSIEMENRLSISNFGQRLTPTQLAKKIESIYDTL